MSTVTHRKEDEVLIQQVTSLGNGADIHQINGDVGIYRHNSGNLNIDRGKLDVAEARFAIADACEAKLRSAIKKHQASRL